MDDGKNIELEIKKCNKCGEIKSFSEFHKNPNTRDGHQNKCKKCANEYAKEYRKLPGQKEKRYEYDQKYYEENKSDILIRKHEYYEENKEEISIKDREYNKKHKEKRKAYNKKYRQENKEKLSIRDHEYYENNKDKVKAYQKTYNEENREHINDRQNEYMKDRYANEPEFRFRSIISASIRQALKENDASKQGQSILKFLPYTIEELKIHIESQFEWWMTWDNYGIYDPKTYKDNDPTTWTWNIDHIIPQSDLPYTSMEDENFKKCWALENLRPYSSKQNMLDGVNRTRHTKNS